MKSFFEKHTHRLSQFFGLLFWFTFMYLIYTFWLENSYDIIDLVIMVIPIPILWVSWQRTKSINTQYAAVRKNHLHNRFFDALELTGHNEISVQIGGIFALEKVAKDDAKEYHVAVYEILCVFVQNHSPLMNIDTKRNVGLAVQFALTVIGRRDLNHKVKLDLKATSLRGAALHASDFEGANLQEADLTAANLRETNFQGADLQKAHLVFANLQEADLNDADLQDADFKNADLQYANLQNANLSRVNLQGAVLQMANLQKVILQRANLQGAIFSGSNLQSAVLSGAILTGGNFVEADFRKAGLQNADLADTNLQGADLQMANLIGANLQGANLTDANLQGATLAEADLTAANIQETNFNGVDIQGVCFDSVKNSIKEQIMMSRWNEKPKGLEFDVPETNTGTIQGE